jgi:hypothetical protein
MSTHRLVLKGLVVVGIVGTLTSCGEPRAVMLPLHYPDGSQVTTVRGEPIMAGYQTYGSSIHANTTALYEKAKPPTCVSCARVGAVVSEPSIVRQTTGFIGSASVGTGAVMTGIGAMRYGEAAQSGELADNTYINNQSSNMNTNRVRSWNSNTNWNSNYNKNKNTNLNSNSTDTRSYWQSTSSSFW